MKNKNNNLLASIAVFAELCDSEKDLRSILKEFIKSVFEIENIYSVDVTQVTSLLNKHFDFELPEAVVRTCLNSLKKDEYLKRSDGKYHKLKSEKELNDISEKLQFKKNSQKEIEIALINYYERFKKREVTDKEKEDLIQDFIHYLIDNGVSEDYSAIISSFVLENSKSDEFVKQLNQTKEGLVLITGLRHTEDLANIGSWNDDLTFYLDTEHLFNSEGYNGTLYHRIFDDFFSLVNEINVDSRNKGGSDIIRLKFFQEVKNEIHGFFHVAEKIVQGKENLSPESAAMEEICKGCKSVADVVRKKTDFELNLKTKGITLSDEINYLDETEYNVIDEKLLKKYSDEFEEEEILNVLRSFSKINYLRRGKNRVRFEKCGHIILTGKYLTRKLSHDLEVKDLKKDIPYATDISFVTNRLWYTLNKGFSKTNSVPATLDVVSKAQLALASLRNRSLDKRYKDLKEDLKNGSINKEKAQEYYYGLREKAKKPEDISSEEVEESLDIIFDNDFEKHLREKSSLKNRLEEKENSISELRAYKNQEERKKRLPIKRNTMAIEWLIWAFFATTYFAVLTGLGYLIYITTSSPEGFERVIETGLTLLSIMLSAIPIYKYWENIKGFIKKMRNRFYRYQINKLK